MSHLLVDRVSFRYDKKHPWLLKEVSLAVPSGTSVSILGPSGSGKSTLFYLLGGLYKPNQGKIELDHQPIFKSGMVGYMPQHSSLFPWMTVKENIELGYKLSKKKRRFSMDEGLYRAGLDRVANAYPHELSGGMQQRVSFLRVLASGYSLICLDEPFASLDALTRTKMQKWLAGFIDSDQTFLFITHQIEEAVLLTDKIYLYPERLQGSPMEIQNPFSRGERFQMRQTSAFWDFVQQVESHFKQQT